VIEEVLRCLFDLHVARERDDDRFVDVHRPIARLDELAAADSHAVADRAEHLAHARPVTEQAPSPRIQHVWRAIPTNPESLRHVGGWPTPS